MTISIIVGLSLSIDIGLIYFNIECVKLLKMSTLEAHVLRDRFPCHCIWISQEDLNEVN